MIIEKKYIKKIVNNREYEVLILHLQCDECKKSFIGNKKCHSRLLLSDHHFCNRKCSGFSFLLKSKREKTNLEKYGNKAFTATNAFRKKFETNCLKKYGVKSHLEVPEILNKIKTTCLEKYGRETFAGSKDHVSKLDYQDIVKKAWVTKLKNGKNKNISSKQEEGMYKLLCSEFGPDNIIRGKRLLKQFVDFYIKPIDLYLQVDGVYWHGLNRSIDEIKKMKTRQDKKIYKQTIRDKNLNQYCKENKLKLIRITDEEFDKLSEEEMLSIIRRS